MGFAEQMKKHPDFVRVCLRELSLNWVILYDRAINDC